MTQANARTEADETIAVALEEALNAYGQACYAFLPASDRQDDLVIRIHFALFGFSKHLVNSYPLSQARAQSNHKAIEAEAFKDARCADMDRICALVQKMRPDLFSRETTTALDLHGATPAGKPRFALEVSGQPVRGRLGTAKSLVKALTEF